MSNYQREPVLEVEAKRKDATAQSPQEPQSALPEQAQAVPAPEAGATVGSILQALAEEKRFRVKFYGSDTHGGSDKPVHLVKHCDVDEVMSLNRLNGRPRIALKSFLKRYGKRKWMKAQYDYPIKAAIAAAHDRMIMFPSGGSEAPFGELCTMATGPFSGEDLCNCGWWKKDAAGGCYEFKCKRPEFCPSCNYRLRVIPAREEFLPAYRKAEHWYGVTVMATSNPEKAGVKFQVGIDEEDNAIHDYFFRLSEHVTWPRLHKYDSQCTAPWQVAAGIERFLKWCIAGHYFDGLHVAGECAFKYFPAPKSPLMVNHTVNPHFHAYGNTRVLIDEKRAANMFLAACDALKKEGDGKLWAYPDICLTPIGNADDMAKTINYVFKAWPFAKIYIDALGRGCPVPELNLEFHSTYFDSPKLLYPFPSPSGTSKWGGKFGNMSQRAGHAYIGDPLPRLLSAQQVKRYLARLKSDDFSHWQVARFEKHLGLKKRRRGLKSPHQRPDDQDTDY